ncbi:MAG TPA: acyl-CoA dehydrogenase [Bdellovibrionota bacterium]|nr:acyl-CoA dehydrogenase [Bdellovibrionota bacterium]
METLFWVFCCVAFLAFGFSGAPMWMWAALGFAVLTGAGVHAIWALTIYVAVAVLLSVPALRKITFSRLLLSILRKPGFVPKISETERQALEAGGVWVERELLSGNPDLKQIAKLTLPTLSVEEQAFLDGPVNRLCSMVHDWDLWQDRELPAEVWNVIRHERFFGIIIPRHYGGLGFSAIAHSEIIARLASRSTALSVTIMVPNSLGPAKLLISYGTEAQKTYYLPRLARGEEIPCFALTEPDAGSDAASIRSTGVVFRQVDGALAIRLNWKKRWTTLAGISTVIGLAFRLSDPENLLGKGREIGITFALVPTRLPGVDVTRRHDPLGVPFSNSPSRGTNVVIPVENIIGGTARAGQGWRMLMESLADGRGISLPAQSSGLMKFVARATGAYAGVRRQFGVPVGRFQGIAEPLARIAGFSYLVDSFRRFTCSALDADLKPSVVTAIAKYHATELCRKSINDAMDIFGGAGITLGPRNLIAHLYYAAPIAITVEGANILTRSLIIFGQGAIRAHPFAWRELTAIKAGNLAAFDPTIAAHTSHFVRNLFRAFLFWLTRGALLRSPVRGPAAKYYRQLTWASATLGALTDFALIGLGGRLKFEERLTGRLADMLSWSYICSVTLSRFQSEGARPDDLPFLHWAARYSLNQFQVALEAILANFPIPILGPLLRGPIRWFARINPISAAPRDRDDLKIAAIMQEATLLRLRHFRGIFEPFEENDPFRRLEYALELENAAAPILKKGGLKVGADEAHLREAVRKKMISQNEFEKLDEARRLASEVIQVDDFSHDEYLRMSA